MESITEKVRTPYREWRPYGSEDADLFFGRDREADAIISSILSNRLTVLHAPSGAGKTSLLNALVIPGIETTGRVVVRVLPQNNPVESARRATLETLLPSPESEMHALLRALDVLAPGEEDIPLADLLTRYDEIPTRETARRELIQPVEDKRAAGPVTPAFCRLLRSSIDEHMFVEHLVAMGRAGEWGAGRFDGAPISVGQLRAYLEDPNFRAAYQRLRERQEAAGPDLRGFLAFAASSYGAHRTSFGIVLVFDQLEEIFTRFVDPVGADHRPNWELKDRFFDEIEQLMLAPEEPAPSPSGTLERSTLPVRYVFSLRDEYLAPLVDVPSLRGRLERGRYRLEFLSGQSAQDAIEAPAKLFGYTYSDACFERIMTQLLREGRYVEPAHLQIVCKRLWTQGGSRLAQAVEPEATDEQVRSTAIERQIPLEVFQDLGEVKGILKTFLTDFLDELTQESPDSVPVALDLLKALITPAGTRNIVDQQSLVKQPLRHTHLRQGVLNILVNRGLIRLEKRLGTLFAEITHEFLIDPVLDAFSRYLMINSDYAAFAWAIQSLERTEKTDVTQPENLLRSHEFGALHRGRLHVDWRDAPWSVEVMLRSALALEEDREVLSVWLSDFERQEEAVDPKRWIDSAMSQVPRRKLTLGQLRAVNQVRTALPLNLEEVELVLASELLNADDSERTDIEYWSRRMNQGVD